MFMLRALVRSAAGSALSQASVVLLHLRYPVQQEMIVEKGSGVLWEYASGQA